jgi:ankyrin repeat protein
MKHLLLTTIAAVVLVGCATTQSPEPPTAKAPDISIHEAAMQRNLEAVKQHIAAGTDVNAKDVNGYTPLDWTIFNKDTKTVDLLRKHGGKTGEELKAEGK